MESRFIMVLEWTDTDILIASIFGFRYVPTSGYILAIAPAVYPTPKIMLLDIMFRAAKFKTETAIKAFALMKRDYPDNYENHIEWFITNYA